VLPLAMRLLASHCKPGERIPALLPDAAQLLLTYDWPGNVRELENVMQRALVLCESDLIRAAHIVFESADAAGPIPMASRIPVEARLITSVAPATEAALIQPPPPAAAPGGALADSLALAEREFLLRALRAHVSRDRAAAELGISARTLRYKLARLRAAGDDLSDAVQITGNAA
jgi:two-component system response regulator FlrC